MWRIPYINLAKQYAEEREELLQCIDTVLASGMHVGGAEVDALEQEVAAYVYATRRCTQFRH